VIDLEAATLVRAGTAQEVRRMLRLGARLIGGEDHCDAEGARHPCVQVRWGRQRVVVVLDQHDPRQAHPD
jgi:hypothetical protein